MTHQQEELMKAISKSENFRDIKELIDSLTDHGENPNGLDFVDENGDFSDFGGSKDTLLHLAAKNTDTRVVDKIMTILPSLKDKENSLGMSPLHIAAAYQNVLMVNHLIEKDFNVKLKDTHNKLFGDYLRGEETFSKVREVYDRKYPNDPMPERQIDNSWMQSYFNTFEEAGINTSMIKFLLRCWSITGSVTTLNEIIELGLGINQQDRNGNTLLIESIRRGHTESAIELLNRETDVNIANNNGKTALIVAVQENNIRIITELLNSRGIDINVSDSDGKTALMIARENKQKEVLELLYSKILNPNRCAAKKVLLHMEL